MSRHVLTRLSSAATGRAAPILILTGGGALRVGLLTVATEPRWTGAEAGQAAIGFARTGFVSDAYMVGQGPTAHLNPVMPAYAGTIYRLFGIHSPMSEALLAGVATAMVLGSLWLLYDSFGRLGVSRAARLVALAACCFLPVYQGMEGCEFRIWEGSFAVLMAAGFLAGLLAMEDGGLSFRGWRALAMAMLASVLLFVSPAFGAAAYACAALSIIATQPRRRWAALALTGVAALAVIVVPWTLRNQSLLGHPVPLRSNFGLELGMGYDPASVTASDRVVAFQARQQAIHPFGNPTAFAAMKRAGGEVAYSHAIGAATSAWIRAHPGAAIELTIDHVRDYLFPPRWIMDLYYRGSTTMLTLRQLMLWAITGLGIAGMLLKAKRGGRRWLYPALFLAAPIALYSITTPVLRYHYAIWALSIFFGASLIDHARRLPRRAGAGAPNAPPHPA